MKKVRHWLWWGAAGVLLLALIGGGEPVRGALIALLGGLVGRLQARA
jgi:lauroyl/myristoyl acyltransferase